MVDEGGAQRGKGPIRVAHAALVFDVAVLAYQECGDAAGEVLNWCVGKHVFDDGHPHAADKIFGV